MSSESERSRLFAASVLKAFERAGYFTDDEVKAAGGPSSSTMTKLRAAKERGEALAAPRSDTLRNIDRVAKWAPGSARALWRHQIEPRPDDGSGRAVNVVEVPGNFRDWIETTDVLSDFQRKQVLRAFDTIVDTSRPAPLAALDDPADRPDDPEE